MTDIYCVRCSNPIKIEGKGFSQCKSCGGMYHCNGNDIYFMSVSVAS
jgi:hypothetical protein